MLAPLITDRSRTHPQLGRSPSFWDLGGPKRERSSRPAFPRWVESPNSPREDENRPPRLLVGKDRDSGRVSRAMTRRCTWQARRSRRTVALLASVTPIKPQGSPPRFCISLPCLCVLKHPPPIAPASCVRTATVNRLASVLHPPSSLRLPHSRHRA